MIMKYAVSRMQMLTYGTAQSLCNKENVDVIHSLKVTQRFFVLFLFCFLFCFVFVFLSDTKLILSAAVNQTYQS